MKCVHAIERRATQPTTYKLTQLLSHSVTSHHFTSHHSLTHSLTHLATQSITCSLPHQLVHSLPPSLSPPLTHSLTHSLTSCVIICTADCTGQLPILRVLGFVHSAVPHLSQVQLAANSKLAVAGRMHCALVVNANEFSFVMRSATRHYHSGVLCGVTV